MKIAFYIFWSVISIIFMILVVRGSNALVKAFEDNAKTQKEWEEFIIKRNKSREGRSKQ
jgi:hypothetical protein